jgi:hypothetical protein
MLHTDIAALRDTVLERFDVLEARISKIERMVQLGKDSSSVSQGGVMGVDVPVALLPVAKDESCETVEAWLNTSGRNRAALVFGIQESAFHLY